MGSRLDRSLALWLPPAIAAAMLASASCSTEGDVLSRKERADATDGGDETSFDTSLLDTGVDSSIDTATVRCGPDAACSLATQSCCLQLLSYSCVAKGGCDGGYLECDRSAHCGSGSRCCGQGAAFSIVSQCQKAPCPVYQLCGDDTDCPDSGKCSAIASSYRVCE